MLPLVLLVFRVALTGVEEATENGVVSMVVVEMVVEVEEEEEVEVVEVLETGMVLELEDESYSMSNCSYSKALNCFKTQSSKMTHTFILRVFRDLYRRIA